MENIYLEKALKSFYMQDFQKLLLDERDFWKIDSQFVREALIKINESVNVQTLYSASNKRAGSVLENNYLKFCYTKNVELKIFREIIPTLILRYNDLENDSKCFYLFGEPKINLNSRAEDNENKFGLGCIDDPNYFKVNHIQIFLECYHVNISKQFWLELSEALGSL